MKNIPYILFALLAVGCGVSDDKPLVEIETELWTKICDVATDASDAATYDCDGFTIEVEAVSAEEAAAACVTASDINWTGGCTFGDWRECNDWEPADFCNPGDPPAVCLTLYACLPPVAVG